jgi:hypothetical protein
MTYCIHKVNNYNVRYEQLHTLESQRAAIIAKQMAEVCTVVKLHFVV